MVQHEKQMKEKLVISKPRLTDLHICRQDSGVDIALLVWTSKWQKNSSRHSYNCMKPSRTSAVNNRSAGQDSPPFFIEVKTSFHFSQKPARGPHPGVTDGQKSFHSPWLWICRF